MPVPFDTYHRDDQPDAVRAATGDNAPVVAAETTNGVVPLLSGAELEELDGSVDGLAAAIDRAVATIGLRWP